MRNGTDIAILGTGPSLREFLAAPPVHDVYVGINRAVEAYPCDWWAFNDDEAFVWWVPCEGGHLRIFTSAETRRRIQHYRNVPIGRIDRFEWLHYAEVDTTCPSDPGWVNFSMTLAMVLGEFLGAKRLTLYGCDFQGTDDWDGPEAHGSARTHYRWQNETHKVGHVERWLGTRGVEVVGLEAA